MQTLKKKKKGQNVHKIQRCSFYLLILVLLTLFPGKMNSLKVLHCCWIYWSKLFSFSWVGGTVKPKEQEKCPKRKNAVTASHYAHTKKIKFKKPQRNPDWIENEIPKRFLQLRSKETPAKIGEQCFASVRWQLVLLLLSAVALCCQSVKEEGVVSSLCLYFFFSLSHPVIAVTGARAWICVGPSVLCLSRSAGTDTGSSRDVTHRGTRRASWIISVYY